MATSGEPYQITVTYTNGTTSTFTGCVSVTETDGKLTFKGRKEGDTQERLWTIVLTNVTEYSKTPEK